MSKEKEKQLINDSIKPRCTMILSRKEFKTCIEELKDLISKTEDEKLKKDIIHMVTLHLI